MEAALSPSLPTHSFLLNQLYYLQCIGIMIQRRPESVATNRPEVL